MTERIGVYERDYFSGAQAALFVGDIWVDEVVSVSYQRMQARTPIYGYASSHFDAVSKGTVLISGHFSINFKEAGYLWLVLNRYKQMIDPAQTNKLDPFQGESGMEKVIRDNVERIVSADFSPYKSDVERAGRTSAKDMDNAVSALFGWAALTGFATPSRIGLGKPGTTIFGKPQQSGNRGGRVGAEGIFEAFEDAVWGGKDGSVITYDGRSYNIKDNRQADDPDLNPFDIYVVYGDYTGDNSLNHTVQKIEDVHLLGNSKVVSIDAQPIIETYSFIARDII